MACCYHSLIALLPLLFAFLIRIYTKLTIGWDKSYTCLVGKTTIVTGANTGVGYETAKEFAKRGARVILACRNQEKAEEARKKIVEETDNKNVVVKIVDFSSLESVRAFAKDINATEERLDILVNNAGAGGVGKRLSNDGLELTMQINYFSSFLLTILLSDLLKKSAPSRIVNVSSEAAKLAKLDVNDMNKFAQQFQMYCRSKLCNILFTKQLAKRLEGTGVTAYSLHPGAVSTDIFRRVKSWRKIILVSAKILIFKNPVEGAQTQIYLSLAKGIEHLSGEHFHDCRKVETYKTADVAGLAEKVWEKSEQHVGLRVEEKRL